MSDWGWVAVALVLIAVWLGELKYALLTRAVTREVSRFVLAVVALLIAMVVVLALSR